MSGVTAPRTNAAEPDNEFHIFQGAAVDRFHIISDATANKIPKFYDTSGTVFVDSVIIESAPQIGIGIAPNPACILDVNGIIRAEARYDSRQGGSNTPGSGSGFFAGMPAGDYAGFQLSSTLDMDFWVWNPSISNWTRPMSIRNNGNVGIGTMTAGTQLEIVGAATVNTDNSRRNMRLYDSTTMAAGVGSGIEIGGKYDTTGNITALVNLAGVKSNATSGDRSGKLIVSIDNSGGTLVPVTTVDGAGLAVTGNITATGSITAASVIGAVYQDVAEWVPATTSMQPGTVVVLNREHSNEVMPSARAFDTAVAGVVSAQPGVILGVASASKAQVATTGRVKVHVDATAAAIAIGDLLVTSDKSGTAMKSQTVNVGGVQFHRPGTVIGKALEPLPKGEGEILVLLSLQ